MSILHVKNPIKISVEGGQSFEYVLRKSPKSGTTVSVDGDGTYDVECTAGTSYSSTNADYDGDRTFTFHPTGDAWYESVEYDVETKAVHGFGDDKSKIGVYDSTYVDVALDELFDNLVTVDSASASFSLAANESKLVNINITKAGYTALALAGYNIGTQSNSQKVAMQTAIVELSNVVARLVNLTSSAASGSVEVYVLYIKNRT